MSRVGAKPRLAKPLTCWALTMGRGGRAPQGGRPPCMPTEERDPAARQRAAYGGSGGGRAAGGPPQAAGTRGGGQRGAERQRRDQQPPAGRNGGAPSPAWAGRTTNRTAGREAQIAPYPRCPKGTEGHRRGPIEPPFPPPNLPLGGRAADKGGWGEARFARERGEGGRARRNGSFAGGPTGDSWGRAPFSMSIDGFKRSSSHRIGRIVDR